MASPENKSFTPLTRHTVTLAHGPTATITACYASSAPLAEPDPAKPTLVLLNSFTTDSSLFAPQFADAALRGRANLLAVDLLGHGGTRVGGGAAAGREDVARPHWTYWDSAWMALGVLREVGVERAVVAGTSQGGWVAVRMALLAPEMVLGVIPMGTSIDFESPASISLGCWDGHAAAAGPIAFCTSPTPTPDFVPPDAYCDYLIDVGLGKDCAADARAFWTARIKENYAGDAGRRRMRTAAVNLAERDGLLGRVADVRCPVLWLHGDRDEVYSVRNAEEGIKAFEGSSDARLEVVEGGYHFLSASSPAVVNKKIAEFIAKYGEPEGLPVRVGTPDVAERVAAGV
ncbi:putative alpha beta fold family hydrolase protein [Neofusicoccum parvum]|uniref:Alpha beta fold family hydrolase protein n=1 Tax=Neofusicoccum parvum TaxID=310453 RepID=A0ACB5S5T5_9PEZI|nr:putative alpha beta fold family hydrolase protein [Neofusicoccum parvum]